MKNKEDIKISLDLEKSREDSIIKSCNTLIICNSLLLIPLSFVFIELMNKLTSVKLFILIFGLILVGTLFTSLFFAILGQYKESYSNNDDLESLYNSLKYNNDRKRTLLFVSNIINFSFYCLFFIFTMVILILL